MPRKKLALVIALLLSIAALVWVRSWQEAEIHPNFIENFAKDMGETHTSQGLLESLVDALAYDHQNKRLAVGRESGAIEIWDLKEEYAKQVINEAHRQKASHLLFTRDGRNLFSSSSLPDSVKLWDAQTGKLLATVGPDFLGPTIYAGAGNYYLTVKSSEVYIYDGRQKMLYPTAYQTSGEVRSLAADGKTGLVAVGTSSGSIDLFQFSLSDQGPNLEKVKEIKPYETGAVVVALGFSADRQSLYTIPGRPGQIDEWSLPGLEKKRTRPTSGNFVTSAKFSPDRRFLALVGSARKSGQGGDYAVELISLESGQ